jgi:hypothetical protein
MTRGRIFGWGRPTDVERWIVRIAAERMDRALGRACRRLRRERAQRSDVENFNRDADSYWDADLGAFRDGDRAEYLWPGSTGQVPIFRFTLSRPLT